MPITNYWFIDWPKKPGKSGGAKKQLANKVEGHAGERYGEACGGKIKAIFKIVIFFQITVVK